MSFPGQTEKNHIPLLVARKPLSVSEVGRISEQE